MGLIIALVYLLIPGAFAQDKPREIDPNTKIQGGADLPGSGANAGAGARTDNRMESETRIERPDGPRLEERGNVAGPDRDRTEKDRPVSARKPGEPRPEDDAPRGETSRPGQ